MPVHQINVNPPDWQPPLSIGPSNNTSPAGGEALSEWIPQVTISRLQLTCNTLFDSLKFSSE